MVVMVAFDCGVVCRLVGCVVVWLIGCGVSSSLTFGCLVGCS